jgi:hypothetical protein
MGIFKFWKLEGETMNEVLDRFAMLYPMTQRTCYVGRLDPMAHGLLFILTNDDVHFKMTLCSLSKTYSFSLLHGIKTDTFDILGMICETKCEFKPIVAGSYDMIYPKWSNYRVVGKPLWYYAKNKIDAPFKPSKRIELCDIKYDDIVGGEMTGENLLKMIMFKIRKINKMTFRQDEIIDKWKSIIDPFDTYYFSNHIVTLTSGGFVRYFGNMMGGTCFNICRMSYNF